LSFLEKNMIFLFQHLTDMNTIIKNKFISTVIIILLLANTVSIVYLWLNKKKSHDKHGEAPFELLVKKTGMDKTQQEQYRELVHQHRKEVAQIRDNVKKAKESFYELLRENNVSDSILKASAKNVSSEIEQIELINFRHFQKVRAICRSGEQQEKFDEVIREVLEMMSSGPGHPPARGERPPGPAF